MADDKSPWGNNTNDDDQNPWKPRQDDAVPPDIEDLLRKSQDKVRRIMKGGKNKKGFDFKSFWGIAGIVVLLWLLTGFYQVQPQEQGVVLRFGKYAYTTAPGLHYHLPYPIETVLTPNVRAKTVLKSVSFPNRSAAGILSVIFRLKILL